MVEPFNQLSSLYNVVAPTRMILFLLCWLPEKKLVLTLKKGLSTAYTRKKQGDGREQQSDAGDNHRPGA